MPDILYGMNPDALEQERGGNQLPDQTPEPEEEFGDPDPIPGFLLSDADGKPPEEMSVEEHLRLAKKALKVWTSQDEIMSRHIAQWKVNEARRRGMVGVAVVKKADRNLWDIYVPPGSTHDSLPHLNHAADLCRKATAQMFADPPAPEVEPPSGDDEDVEAAKFSERVLLDIQGPHGLDESGTAREAFDKGHTFGSGFVRYYVDPKGGGRIPIQVQAGKDPMTGARASHVSDAAYRMVMQPQASEDPLAEPQVEQVQEPWPEFEDRFVAKDGTLVDDDTKAATRWAPGIKREILTGRNVRFIPHTARDLWDADGVMIGCFLPWRRIKKMFPFTRDFDEEKRKKLFSFKPEQADDILPDASGAKPGQPIKDNEDESLVFVLTFYYQTCDDYPDGCYFISLANCYVAYRDKWMAEIDGKPKSLLIPLTQYRQWREGQDNPYTTGTMQIVGPGNEIRGMQIGAWFDHLERFNNPHIFIPTNSILQNKYRHLPRGELIPINPGGKPEYEDVPQFPTDSKELFSVVTNEMDNSVNLGPAAEGLDSSDVKSGRHAFAVISQVHAGLSEPKQNIERGYVRACQVQLQLVQAFFDVPRQIRWMGEDGEHVQQAWMGADLGDATDVRVKPGTMTLLSPAAKMQLLRSFYVEDQIIQPAEYKDAVADALAGAIILEDDPFRMRVKRQIAAWRKGPEGPVQGQPIVTMDPMTGMPVQQMGPDPRAVAIWTPVPADNLPDVAAMRLQEIGKLMSSNAYTKHPPEWRMAVDMEFQNMQMAAMPAPPVTPEGDASDLSSAESADVNAKAEAEMASLGVGQ